MEKHEEIQERILEEIRNERRRQDAKWGVSRHTILEWFAILAEEFGEVAMNVTKSAFSFEGSYAEQQENRRKELIQVAAVCVKWLEAMEDYREVFDILEGGAIVTVEEIVKEWLKEHGFDGLCGDDCGCFLADLGPCGDICASCEPGYKMVSPTCHSSCERFKGCLSTKRGDGCPYAPTGDAAQPFETEEAQS